MVGVVGVVVGVVVVVEVEGKMNDTLKTIDALPDLLPCPLCRSSMIGSDNCGTLNRIFCYDCGLQLDTAFEADGTSRWNRRAASLRWTRVEDRLPEKPGDFITTRIKNTDGTGLTVRETHFHPNNPHLIKIWMEVVKAWMPLPEPFTEDTDEQR